MAEPSSSAHFVSYAVAFYIATYGSAGLPPWNSSVKPHKMLGTYTEIARLQPDCNFSVMLRKMRKSGGTAGICYCYFTTDYGNNPCCLLSLYWGDVDLSNICYTLLNKFSQDSLWWFPPQRSHGKLVILSTVIGLKLLRKILKGIESMGGIKTFIILAVAAFHFSVMAWCKGSNQFMMDSQSF